MRLNRFHQPPLPDWTFPLGGLPNVSIPADIAVPLPGLEPARDALYKQNAQVAAANHVARIVRPVIQPKPQSGNRH